MDIRYILDTDSVTYHQLGKEAIVRRLSHVSHHVVATTVVTMYEQLRGRLAAIKSEARCPRTAKGLSLSSSDTYVLLLHKGTSF